MANEVQPILFEGDNYHADWHAEAKKRGLPNITNAVDAAEHFTTPAAVTVFTNAKVLSRRELESRQEIFLQAYAKHLRIEARAASAIAHTQIIPATVHYAGRLGDALRYLPKTEHDELKTLSKELTAFRKTLKALDAELTRAPVEDPVREAKLMRDKIIPQLEALRTHADRLEQQLDDALWPLPKYREMLFIR